jgi:hypothetical protein
VTTKFRVRPLIAVLSTMIWATITEDRRPNFEFAR